MKSLLLSAAMVAAAVVITFGLGALLEQTAFKAGPEPGVGAPSGTPVPVGLPGPGERRGRAPLHPREV
jgi:hypothetical protein